MVRYGVDAAEIRGEAGHRAEERGRFGIADDEIVIGTVANLRATKGYPDLLAAAREVTRRAEHGPVRRGRARPARGRAPRAARDRSASAIASRSSATGPTRCG